MKDKKIALVHDWLIKYGGAERVLQVLGEMYPESPIYTLLFNEQEKDKFNLKNKIISSFLQRWPNFIKKRQKLLLPFFPAAIESLDLSEYDLIISDSNSFAHGVLTPPECIHVCYCHSPTRYLWDWKSEYLEENNIRGLKRIIINLFLNWLRIWDYYSAKRVDLWLANSYNVARRIKKYYGFNAKVVYPPIELSRFKVREVKESYFLILSRIEHYK